MTEKNLIGSNILGYTVDEKIGSGGFGTVYKVSKKNASGSYVRALKHISLPNQKQYNNVLNSMGGDYSKAKDYFEKFLEDISNEIKILNTLSEKGVDNIIRYYENDIIENQEPFCYDIYILMEYLTPYSDFLEQNVLTVSDVIDIGLDILSALKVCHENGIIHRDIKDDNIFVSKDRKYKLGDFGVSKVLKDKSKAESMKGTPNFIAPEVYLGKESYTNSVDLYSLGIVLYKLLNYSRNPFLPQYPNTYDASDEDKAFEERMKGQPPSLPFNGGEELGNIIVKSISEQEIRYTNAEDFYNDLLQIKNNMSLDEKNVVINTISNNKLNISASNTINETTEDIVNKTMDEIIKPQNYDETISEENNQIDSKLEESPKNKDTTVNDNINRHLFETIGEIIPEQPITESITGEEAITIENVHTEQSNLTNQVVEETIQHEEVEAIDRKYLSGLIYILPFLISVIGIITILVTISTVYSKVVFFIVWLFSGFKNIIETMQDPYKVLPEIYGVVLWLLFIVILIISFHTSLYLAWKELRKQENPNVNSVFYKALARYINRMNNIFHKKLEGHDKELQPQNLIIIGERKKNVSVTIAICSLASKTGCTHFSTALALTLKNRKKKVCMVQFSNFYQSQTKIPTYSYADIDIYNLYDYDYIILDVGNIESIRESKQIEEYKRANYKLMMCTLQEPYLKNLSDFIREQASVNKWKFVFNYITNKKIRKVDELMEDYDYYCLPVFDIDEYNEKEIFNVLISIIRKF